MYNQPSLPESSAEKSITDTVIDDLMEAPLDFHASKHLFSLSLSQTHIYLGF